MRVHTDVGFWGAKAVRFAAQLMDCARTRVNAETQTTFDQFLNARPLWPLYLTSVASLFGLQLALHEE